MAVSQRVASSPVVARIAGGRLIRAIGYWIFTVFVAWEMILGAYWDLFQIPYVRNVFTHLHLPSYFLIVMGIWKLPCAVVLLIPGVTRMKEWAYAGAFFTYSGAAVLHLSVGDSMNGWAGPVLYALFTVVSWILRPPSRRLVAKADGVGPKGRFEKSRLAAYWIATVLMAFVVISGGIAELSNSKTTIDGMLSLGYPIYFTHLLGCWKIAGGIVLLAPGLPLVKEWAYIGIFLDMTGAFMTHIVSHSAAQHLVFTGLFAVLTVLSWAFRPATRKIVGPIF
ncbi:MAG: DoxX family protein [Sphingobacteriales bacterium]|nr:DoxX family protein [Sphingobacteriales bacterium]